MFFGTSHSLYSLWGFVVFEKIKEYSIGFTNKENLIQENRGHLSNYLKVEKRQLTLTTAGEMSSRSAARDCDFPAVNKSCFWRPCLINPSISSCASVPPSGRLPWFLAACRLLSAPWCSLESGGEIVGIGITYVVLHCASHSSWGWPHQYQHHAFNLPRCQHACSRFALLPLESKARSLHFIPLNILLCTFHFLLILSTFHLCFASRPSPSSPTLRLIPYPCAHASCPLPYFSHSSVFPCTSVSGDLCLPYASRHFHQHSFWKFCWCFDWVTQLMWELATWISCVFS